MTREELSQEDVEQLASLGKQLHPAGPTPEASERMRSALLQAAAHRPTPARRRGPTWWVAAAAAVVMLVGGVVLGSLWSGADDVAPTVPTTTLAQSVRPLQPPSVTPQTASAAPVPPKRGVAKRGTVVAHGHAIFLHASEPPNEVVRLVEGSITVSVDKLLPGERFRVVTSDGEVEVKGTVFDVTVADDRLVGVRVVLGRVEVRKGDAPTVTLEAGGRWTPTAEPEDVTALTEPTPRPTPSVVSKPAAKPSPRKVAGKKRTKAPKAATVTASRPEAAPKAANPSLFREGWTAYRGGRLAEAEKMFARLLKKGRSGLSPDAAFWRAMALKRMGKRGEATKAFRYFLKHFSGSTRAAEARVLLGWLRLGAGARAEARALFDKARKARSAKVRASAEKGLQRLER